MTSKRYILHRINSEICFSMFFEISLSRLIACWSQQGSLVACPGNFALTSFKKPNSYDVELLLMVNLGVSRIALSNFNYNPSNIFAHELLV